MVPAGWRGLHNAKYFQKFFQQTTQNPATPCTASRTLLPKPNHDWSCKKKSSSVSWFKAKGEMSLYNCTGKSNQQEVGRGKPAATPLSVSRSFQRVLHHHTGACGRVPGTQQLHWRCRVKFRQVAFPWKNSSWIMHKPPKTFWPYWLNRAHVWLYASKKPPVWIKWIKLN